MSQEAVDVGYGAQRGKGQYARPDDRKLDLPFGIFSVRAACQCLWSERSIHGVFDALVNLELVRDDGDVPSDQAVLDGAAHFPSECF